MELFSKIYNCYYQVVGRILSECEKAPADQKQLRVICDTYGFGESALFLMPKLLSGEWELLKETENNCYCSRLHGMEKIPFTGLQKSWLKALLADSRIRLFFEEDSLKKMEECLKDIEPLYRQEDFYYFDRYQDGDSYEALEYQENFRLVFKACEENKLVSTFYESRKETGRLVEFFPYQIVYSGKEDKFRVEAVRAKEGKLLEGITLNMERMKSCRLMDQLPVKDCGLDKIIRRKRAAEPVLIEISGERNSLERCMLHFASYEKKTEYQEDKKCYLCRIYYDKQDETELLIQVLSFGPVIRVLGPDSFLKQVKNRVKKQYELWHGEID